MKIVFAGYINVPEFDAPDKWLRRIKGYIGIPESLSKYHSVTSIEQINYSGRLLQNGVEYHFLNFKKKRNYFPWKLHRFIKKLKPDIVIVHSLHFPLQVVLLKLQLKSHVKIIVQNHAEKPFTGLKKYATQFADRFINAYMFTSVEMGREWVEKGIIANSKKIWGIMEASSFFKPMERSFALQKTVAKEKNVYLFVGRLDKNKDPKTVIKAFLQYQKKNHDATLYMIYHTTDLLHYIQQLLAEEINGNSVILIGKVLHDDMLYWYNSADFIISGSHYEGSGVAVCEAMSCGCIPVLTNILSFKKLTANEKCGLLYEAGNTDELYSALLKTQKMDIALERKKVLDQFSNDLSFEAIAAQINSNISSLS